MLVSAPVPLRFHRPTNGFCWADSTTVATTKLSVANVARICVFSLTSVNFEVRTSKFKLVYSEYPCLYVRVRNSLAAALLVTRMFAPS